MQSGSPSAKSAVADAPQGNVCDRKLLGVSDVDGILDTAVSGTKPLQGDAQTCHFITASDAQGGGSISVSLRGNGKATLATFTSGKMNDYAKWKPLVGVGDEAVWLPDLHEVDARKGDTLCVVGVPMFMSKALRDAGEAAQQQKLGGLCNTVFARLGLGGAATSIAAATGGNELANPCDRVIAPTDVAGILTAPATRQNGLNPQSCDYHAQTGASGATVTVSVAKGDEANTQWQLAQGYPGTWDTLGGVGDEARHGRGGTVLVARKGDVFCQADLTGTDNADGMQVVTRDRGEALARKLGALCSKIFAAY